MLTSEERQRIEEEERKRIAEEQYRSEVRAKLRSESAASTKESPGTRPWAVIFGIVVAGVICLIILANTSKAKTGSDSGAAAQADTSATAKTRYLPVSQKIATGQITVRAGGYIPYRITITPEMVDPRVTGNFTAYGGSGNDILAVVADERSYTNWINGHEAQVLWGTQGKQTTGDIEAKFLQPGEYYLAFSNRFSVFTDKQVSLEVDLNYKKAETYY
jgi:hypothetical protein